MSNIETKPLVSVIIPTFNRANLIGRTIESVLQQTYPAFEILVADDASTDDTSKVVTSFQDSRIHYLKNEINAGASSARNMGVGAATGEFIAFLDSDDVWMPNKLELQVAALLQCADPDEVVCYTQMIVESGTAQRLMPTRAKRSTEPVGDFVLGSEGLIHTSSLMLSRELAETTPFPLDQQTKEDWDVFLRLEQKKVRWLFINQPLAVWSNDPRQDRLSNMPSDMSNIPSDMSLKWLREHESMLSSRAIRGYMFNYVAKPLINSGQRRAYAFWLVFAAVIHGAVAPIKGMLEMARAVLPKSFRVKLKSLLKDSSHHPR